MRVQDHGEPRPYRAMIDQRARLAAGLEPLHGKAWTDEIEHQPHGPFQFIGPVTRRLHSQQLNGHIQERRHIHGSILPACPGVVLWPAARR